MHKINKMAGRGWRQHIVNFTFVFDWYQYDLLSWKYDANEKTKFTLW